MNIIYVTSSNTASGGSRQALYTAQGLAARGHDLRFFVPTGAALPGLAPHLHWEELPARRSDWGAAISRTLPRNASFVVHAFHNKAVKMAAWQGLFWHGRGGVVAAQRGVIYKPNNPLPYWSPGIDCFVANSQACASVLRAKGVGDKRLHVVYNGIPRERVTPQRSLRAMRGILNLPDQALVFGCVANDSANKGGSLLLRAFAEANIPHARLLLLGVSPDAYAPIAAELGIADRVQLPGKQECVADYLQVCQAFVLPSLSESMPNTLQEAVCMGLPVLASNVGGVPECIQGNGLLLPPGDVRALAQGLARMAGEHEQRAQWAAASRELAALFSMERKVLRMEELYRLHLRRRGRNGA